MWTQTDIDRLKTAMAASGSVQSMTFGDQTFTFRSLADMQKLLALMEQDAATSRGTSAPTRYAATSKGV
jgi:hypothetical protein